MRHPEIIEDEESWCQWKAGRESSLIVALGEPKEYPFLLVPVASADHSDFYGFLYASDVDALMGRGGVG